MNSVPTKKLGDVVELQYGKGIDRGWRTEHGKVPIYGANGILDWTDKSWTSGEAIIVGRKGSAGEITRVSGKFWPSDVTYYVFGNKQIDIDYLFYFLKSVNLPRLAVGVKQGINRNRVYEIEIPVPPVGEQKKIVARIERQFVEIDEVARLRAESEAATAALLPAALHEIFSQAESRGWDVEKIKDICEHPQYGFTASSTRSHIGPRLLRITDIQNGLVDWNTVPYCKCDTVYKYQLTGGDIVFARTGATVGKSFLIKDVPNKVIFASYLIRLRVKERVSPEFLYYFFQSPDYWNQISAGQVGMAQPNVNGTKLAQIKIPLPPLAEQKEIVKKLDALSEKVRALQALQAAQAADLKALKQSILHEAFAQPIE